MYAHRQTSHMSDGFAAEVERVRDSKAPGQIRSHTGIRGIAALLVVAYHQEFGSSYKLPFELSTNVFRRSYLMVDLFFVLSGFIISYVYAARPEKRLSWSDTKDFLFARFARIYPLHFVTMAYMLVFAFASTMLLSALGHGHGSVSTSHLGGWLVQLALLQAWLPHYDAWNIPSWSISAEVFAYLLFPILVALHARKRRLTEVGLLALALGFYCYVAAARHGSLDITGGIAPFRCIAGFGLGMIIYFNRSAGVGLSEPALSGLQIVAITWAALALSYKISDPLIMAPFGLIVLLTSKDRGLLSAILSRRPFQWLGDISYSIYLTHVPISATLWFFWSRMEPKLGLVPPITRCIWLVAIFGAVLISSNLTYRYIEVPARRLLIGKRRRRQTIGAAIVAAP
jgi:peptidoglycan/LPS O-acetylase OafA/YrhL